MAYEKRVYQVFVAGPAEVAAEKAIIKEAAQHLNQVIGKEQSSELEVLTGDDAIPSIGGDPQGVINGQFDAPDILVAVLWRRLGSPTPRAQSGTVEEYERARDRYYEDPSTSQVMFYFKTDVGSIDEVDPDELAAVRRFRDTLGDEGVLWRKFKNGDELKEIIQVHLASMLRVLAREDESESAAKRARPVTTDGVDAGSDEALGFLDGSIAVREEFDAATELTEEFGHSMRSFNDKLGNHSRELQVLNKSEPDLRVVNRVTDRAADDMDAYAERIRNAARLLENRLTAGMDALTAVVVSLSTFPDRDDQQLRELNQALDQSQVAEAKNALASLRDAVNSLPDLSSRFRAAKRKLTRELGTFLAMLERFDRRAAEVRGLLQNLESD
ncbi:MAG: hypothetical protein AAFX05_07290 [Planctomycetota bacterium]